MTTCCEILWNNMPALFSKDTHPDYESRNPALARRKGVPGGSTCTAGSQKRAYDRVDVAICGRATLPPASTRRQTRFHGDPRECAGCRGDLSAAGWTAAGDRTCGDTAQAVYT